MRWFIRIASGLVLAVIVLVLAGFLVPAGYTVQRSIVIAAPVERIYPLIATPKRWREWSMWNRRDPAMSMTWFGPDAGAGAGWTWDSRSEGKGKMTLLTGDPAHGMTYELFFPDYDISSTGELRLDALADGSTQVTWNNIGHVGWNPLMHYMALAMDRMVGPDFEAGLANLKAIAEHR
jgi:hypothetical protein